MQEINIGDIVVRKSYGGDIFFEVIDIMNKKDGGVFVLLEGVEHRLIADAPLDDLIKPTEDVINAKNSEYTKLIDRQIKKILLSRRSSSDRGLRFRADETFGRAGKVLHVDGDEGYLNTCVKTYEQLNMDVTPRLVEEAEQPEAILDFLNEIKPDILVLTGHDAILKKESNYKNIDSYRSSRYFIEAVKRARSYEPSLDDLVIFAGACQSYYEAIIEAGANFASSPHRVLIHALDPVFVCEKVAFTGINTVLSIQEAISTTVTGIKGIGGLQTRGKYREGFPKSPYK